MNSVKNGALGRILWAKSRETHPGPHSEWFWDIEQAGGGCILDLGCHCVEIARSFIGKDIRPIEVMCWADTLVHPIEAEDNAIALIKFESGAVGQFEVSWTFRGGLDVRDEVAGTEGTIWLNHFLRTGFELFTTGETAEYVAEKAESASGWLFPLGDEITVGRAAGCQVTVDDTYVSQLHARVFTREGQLFVEDLGSTNGTYLNRGKVAGPMVMHKGDRLQVGNTVLEVR